MTALILRAYHALNSRSFAAWCTATAGSIWLGHRLWTWGNPS